MRYLVKVNDTQRWECLLAKKLKPDAKIIGIVQLNSITDHSVSNQYIGAVCGMWMADYVGVVADNWTPSSDILIEAFDHTQRTVRTLTAPEIKQLAPTLDFVGAAWVYDYVVIVR